MTEGRRNQKKASSEVKIFTVPFTLGEIKEDYTITTHSDNQREKEELIRKAIGFQIQGNLSQARKYYQDCINKGFNDHRVFSNYGGILKSIGKLQEAVLYLRKAIEIKPDFADAYCNLGDILKDFGELKEAEIYTRKAIKYKSNFYQAYCNLGNILRLLGKFEEAEKSFLRALKLNPENKLITSNLISLLTIYKPIDVNSNQLYTIDEEFQKIKILIHGNKIISNNNAVKIYQDGLKIYRKYNLNLESSLSQIFKRNEINLNCRRHKLIFNQKKIIPKFCFGCYKVQVHVDSIIELLKLLLVFNTLKLENNNTRKCLIEIRNNITGFYKGLIYCSDLNEAFKISKIVNLHLKNKIRSNLRSEVKRGCSEYALDFPKYKEIRKSGDQLMNYDQNWREIEEEFDKGKQEWGKSSKSLEGFHLNDFLIMRNWIAYAQKIGDKSVNEITNEKINLNKFFNNLSKDQNAQKKVIK